MLEKRGPDYASMPLCKVFLTFYIWIDSHMVTHSFATDGRKPTVESSSAFVALHFKATEIPRIIYFVNLTIHDEFLNCIFQDGLILLFSWV